MSKSIIEEIENLKRIVEEAKRVPFSKYITLDRDEILGALMRIEAMLPEEVKLAVNISKQKEMILKDAYEEKERILKEAEKEFKKKVEESNILEEARRRSDEIIKAAIEESEKIKEEALLFVKDLLSKVEGVLDKAKNAILESKEGVESEIADRQNRRSSNNNY